MMIDGVLVIHRKTTKTLTITNFKAITYTTKYPLKKKDRKKRKMKTYMCMAIKIELKEAAQSH